MLAFFLAACSSIGVLSNPPKVSLAGLSLKEFNLFEQAFAFKLRVTNPNDQAIVLDTLSFTVEIDGVQIAEGSEAGPFSLPASGNAVWEVNAHSETLKIMKALKKQPQDKYSTYRLQGKVRVEGLGFIPFSTEGEIPTDRLR